MLGGNENAVKFNGNLTSETKGYQEHGIPSLHSKRVGQLTRTMSGSEICRWLWWMLSVLEWSNSIVQSTYIVLEKYPLKICVMTESYFSV